MKTARTHPAHCKRLQNDARCVSRTVLRQQLLVFLLVCIPGACTSKIVAASGSAPLYVAIVNIGELGQYAVQRSSPSVGAALRAAGYPASPSLSKPPLPRAVGAAQQQAPADTQFPVEAAPVGPDGPSLGPSGGSNYRRKLHQQTGSIQMLAGYEGTSVPAPAGTSALAVGPQHMLQAVGASITITNISSSRGTPVQGSSRRVALASLMAGAATDCQDVFDPAAVYDHHASRFLVSATCGGQGRVLLAASSTSDANGAWFVFGLVADGVNTSLACLQPVTESAIVDYTQLTYNTDGIFVTYKSMCPSNASAGGVGLLALPKHAVYKGIVNFMYPVYTSAELQQATAAANAAGAGECSQLQPVVPQGPEDVPQGAAYFVCQQVSPVMGAASRSLNVSVAALLDTAMLWHWAGPDSRSSTPMMAAAQLVLTSSPAPPTGLLLRQPGDAPALQRGARPVGFWNGAAVLAAGKLYLASSAMVVDASSSSYSRRPAVAWAEASIAAEAAGADSCPQSLAGKAAAGAYNWTADYSVNWGSKFVDDAAHVQNASFEQRLTGAASAGGSSSHTIIKAAHVGPLLVGAGVAAANALYGGRPCSCYACYWGGAYYRYGGYNGGLLQGQGYGFGSTGSYFFAQGRMTECQSFCTRCWYYGYPGHGFGNVGDDLDTPLGSLLGIRSVNGQLTPATATPADFDALLASSLPDGDDIDTIFSPCNRSARLSVSAVRQGVLTQGGSRPLGLVYPTISRASAGQLLLTFSYAGPGNITAGVPAHLGVGSAVLPAGTSSSSSSNSGGGVQPVKKGRGTIQPALPPGSSRLPGLTAAAMEAASGWAELSAAAVHPSSGKVFTAAHYAAERTTLAGSVGTWISSWAL